MGWLELLAWAGAMNRQLKGPELSPDSWAGYENSEWYQAQRRKRDAERQR
jgi:hypothetical protein